MHEVAKAVETFSEVRRSWTAAVTGLAGDMTVPVVKEHIQSIDAVPSSM
ncbi:hypothetical protein [Mesorhizobium sp. 128a]